MKINTKKHQEDQSHKNIVADNNIIETVPNESVQAINENDKKMSKLNKLSTFWTLISTIYAIITAISLLAKNWVQGTMANVLIAVLVIYIIAFIAIIVLSKSDPKKMKGMVKTYKGLLGIFKGFASVVFLVLSAVSMAGLAMEGDMNFGEWAVFLTTLFVAVIKLAFKITNFAFKIYRKKISKKFKVKITRYVDGKEQKQNTLDAINEKLYK